MRPEYEIYKTLGYYSSFEIEKLEQDSRDILVEEGMDPTAEEVTEHVYDSLDTFYEDERQNLFKKLDGRVIAIADLGLWNGRRKAYKILSKNLNDVLWNISCDDIKVFYDGYNVKAEGMHHDGVNKVEYREIREDRNIDVLLDKLYNNKDVSRSDINYYTKSLGGYIKEIYGW